LPDSPTFSSAGRWGQLYGLGRVFGSLPRWKSGNLARVLRLVDLAVDIVCLHMITFALVNVTVDIVCLRTLLLIVSALVNLAVDIVCLHVIAFALLHVLGNILSGLE
jgi:hypothetical protein